MSPVIVASGGDSSPEATMTGDCFSPRGQWSRIEADRSGVSNFKGVSP
jgi:hypothetical protein